jgi:hypothetical protein
MVINAASGGVRPNAAAEALEILEELGRIGGGGDHVAIDLRHRNDTFGASPEHRSPPWS